MPRAGARRPRLEARGEIRGGRFVNGFAGEQFALPDAVGDLISFHDDFEQTISEAFARLHQRGWCRSGDSAVVITNALASGRVIDTLQLRPVP